eukprot:CAMPEP_0114226660 /NCGR_PEP_ID=MMETSP0058-20121206/1355_1 /TAXON_ID=36894 /ORGANISM="Pyramimonas parkeae, CCMP726" /LENGTH=148 /DNA_ID=CAMNT_0001337409 /DNA_START=481 /DNA_END=927 /DNA_ORIENTATION=-
MTSPHRSITTGWMVSPSFLPVFSICLKTSIPETSLPKTTCLPLSEGARSKVTKNCEPLVWGPALAMLSSPGPEWECLKLSSAKSPPYMDSPPLPSPLEKSPPWATNPGTTRWMAHPSYVSSMPVCRPRPFSPVHSARKFSHVRGQSPV